MISSIHRLHLLERFDEVLFMRAGRIIAQGPPEVLAANLPELRAHVAKATASQDESDARSAA